MIRFMARTESTMLSLGTTAPDFGLPDTVSGETLNFRSVSGSRGTLVVFICNHCPYVIHINSGLVALAKEIISNGIGVVAISSNDALQFPADGPEKMRLVAMREGYPFPYLYDESQEVARSYQAACTPDFYLFDASHRLVYRGQFDSSRPGNGIPVTGSSLRQAVEALLQGRKVPEEQYPSLGCNIKWKS